MIKFLSQLPIYVLICIVLFEKNPSLGFSMPILQYCLKEQILFRYIPFLFIEKNVTNCFIVGIMNGICNFYIVKFSFFNLFVHCFVGCIYTLASRQYNFVEVLQLRYYLLIYLH